MTLPWTCFGGAPFLRTRLIDLNNKPLNLLRRSCARLKTGLYHEEPEENEERKKVKKKSAAVEDALGTEDALGA